MEEIDNVPNQEPKVSFTNLYRIVIGILIIICILLLTKTCNSGNELDSLRSMYNSANTKTQHYKDKWGREVAKSEQVKSMDITDFTNAEFSDPTMKELQEEVRKNADRLKEGGSVTVIKTTGQISKTTPTSVTYPKPIEKTIPNKPCDTVYAIYSTPYKDKWIEYNIVAQRDSTKLDFSYSDTFSVTLGEEKNDSLPRLKRWFSEPVSYAWVTSESPYTKVKETKTYKVSTVKPSRISVGLIGGYGYDLIGLKPTVFIGIGTSYRLFDIGKKKVN